MGRTLGGKHWGFLKTWHCYRQGLGPEEGNGTWHHLPTELCSIQSLGGGAAELQRRGRQKLALTHGYLSSDYDPEHGSQSPKDPVLSSEDDGTTGIGMSGRSRRGLLADHPSHCGKGLCSSERQGIKNSCSFH